MNKKIEQKLYLPYAEGMRVVAIFAVLLLHSAASRLFRFEELALPEWWWCNIFDSMSRWAVPVFVMLSGAIFLNPHRKDSLKQFYFKRLKRICIPLITWSVFYFYYYKHYYGIHVDVSYIAQSIRDGMPQSHLYFLYVILGLYLVAPLLRLVVHQTPAWHTGLIIAAVMIFAHMNDRMWLMRLTAWTRFIPFIGYYLLGYVLSQQTVSRTRMVLAGLGYASATVAIIVGTYGQFLHYPATDNHNVERFYYYSHPLVIVQSSSVFLFLKDVLSKNTCFPLHKGFSVLSPVVFGVYLSHQISFDFIRRWSSAVFDNDWLMLDIPLETTLGFALSIMIAFVLWKIPYVRRVVG